MRTFKMKFSMDAYGTTTPLQGWGLMQYFLSIVVDNIISLSNYIISYY